MRKVTKILSLVLALTLIFTMVGCSKKEDSDSEKNNPIENKDEDKTSDPEDKDEDEKYVIGFAQSRMNHSYRVAAISEFNKAMEEKNVNWELIVLDGQNDTAKQTSDVEDLITQKVDLIVMSPITAEPLVPAAQKVMDSGIPLLLLDRTISTDDYTTFVGGDNVMAGVLVAETIAEKLDGANGKVVEIQGNLGSSATTDRHNGFADTIAKYPNIEVISDTSGEFDRATALKLTEDILQTATDIDAIYCHNDSMAIGAMTAIQAQGLTDIDIYGIDGTKEVFDEIKKGNITGSVIYPTGSTKAVEVIEMILAGEPFEKHYLVDVPMVDASNVEEYYDQGIGE